MKKCPFCAEEIQDAAKVCKHCGRELSEIAVPVQAASTPKEAARESAAKNTAIGCGVIVLAMFAGCWWLFPPGDSPDPQRERGTSIRITAADLLGEYDANSVAADLKFEDQAVIVTGTIDDIGEELLGRPYIVMRPGGGLSGVQALFARDNAAVVAGLSKGQAVTVHCTFQGKLLMSVIVEDCSLQ